MDHLRLFLNLAPARKALDPVLGGRRVRDGVYGGDVGKEGREKETARQTRAGIGGKEGEDGGCDWQKQKKGVRELKGVMGTIEAWGGRCRKG